MREKTIQRYMNKSDIARIFGISLPTVYKRVAGIEEEIKKGRYNQYAIAENLINIAVFVDYFKYYKRLKDKNLRRTVPDFNLHQALEYLMEFSDIR